VSRPNYEAMSDDELAQTANRRSPSTLEYHVDDHGRYVGLDRKRTIEKLRADDEELADLKA